jgi:hypothetical protein
MAGAADQLPLVMETRVIPDGPKRRSGIHAGTLIGNAPEWIPGQARDDDVFL